ncbi:hypothetical protein EYC84_008547 [Monilinia fructicola]|uniref:DUF1993 domain-containing protein n=1 Tax=Monilinia fructicola TaxID=38448 RepID=A0A5M9JHL8_MONFR|nr:hypothetical protein EYC84_008547 [Monilinia fructicola]
MSITLYDITVPPFLKQLKSLSKILAKGLAHFNNDESKLIHARLIEDQGDLVFQIQRVSESAKGLAVRVAGVEDVVFEDNEADVSFGDFFFYSTAESDVNIFGLWVRLKGVDHWDLFPAGVTTSRDRGSSGHILQPSNQKAFQPYSYLSLFFAGLYTRINRTIEILEALPASSLNDKENTEITLKIGDAEHKLHAKDYVLYAVIPNFYFHVTTAYSILRKVYLLERVITLDALKWECMDGGELGGTTTTMTVMSHLIDSSTQAIYITNKFLIPTCSVSVHQTPVILSKPLKSCYPCPLCTLQALSQMVQKLPRV